MKNLLLFAACAACLLHTAAAAIAVTAVDTTTIATTVAKTVVFTATSLVDDTSRPWFKLVASGGDCTAAAIGTWAKGQLTYVSATSGNFAITAPLGFAASSGNKVCWSAAEAGTYAQVASAVMATTVTAPTVTAVDTTTIATTVAKDLDFTTTNLVDDTSRPWFKLVASGGDCTAAAIGTWAAGQFTFASATSGTFAITAPLGTAASTGNKVCWSATTDGTYAQVGSAVMAVTVTAPAVSGVDTATIATTVAKTLDFTTTNLVNDATRPWFKLVASGGDCSAAAIGTWAAGQFTFASATSGTFAITAPYGTAASTGNKVCWSATTDGTYAQVPTTAVMAVTVTALGVTGVDTTSIATGLASTLAFTTAGMGSGSEAWFKLVASGGDCTAAAIGTWATGKLTFVSAISGTFAITAPYGTTASSGNKVCWSAATDGTYAQVGSAVMAVTVGGGFSAQPTTSDITSSNVTITVTPGEDVNVKCGVFARNATAPTAAEVYAGTGTGGAAVNTTNGPVVAVATIAKNGASTAISGKIMGLTESTLYDVYCATNDATKVLSSPVVQFSTTATTTTAAATTAAPAATTTVSGASSEAAWSTMLTVFAIAMAAFSTL